MRFSVRATVLTAAMVLGATTAVAQGRMDGGRDRVRDPRDARDRARAAQPSQPAAMPNRDDRGRGNESRDNRGSDRRGNDARDDRGNNGRGNEARDDRGNNGRGSDARDDRGNNARNDDRDRYNDRDDRGRRSEWIREYDRSREYQVRLLRDYAYRNRGHRWYYDDYDRLPWGWDRGIYIDAIFGWDFDRWSHPVPYELERYLPPLRRGHRRVMVGDRIIVFDVISRHILLVIRL
jgi:hypothetical protein